MQGAIRVQGLGKRFRRYGADRPTTFKETVLRGFRYTPVEYFWGLRDVSFEVTPGRAIGVVGKNGAGKSTLLRLIGGVGRPDEGKVEVHGRIGALLDIGSGLTDDLTGRENVFVAGVIAGMTRAEIARRFDDVVAFAELEAFIDSPLRTYSTGMRMRLAFAVAIHIEPDILLVDEVLAVGDSAFQRKCLARVAEIKVSGCTIFLVSHDPSQIKALCDEVVFLKLGRAVAIGPTHAVMSSYETSADPQSRVAPAGEVPDVVLANGRRLRFGENRFGSLEAEITDVRVLDGKGAPTDCILAGAGLAVELDYRSNGQIREPKVAVSIYRSDGTMCLDMNTELGGVELSAGAEGGSLRVAVERLDLAGGDYFVQVGLYQNDWGHSFDLHERAYPLAVVGGSTGQGFLSPPVRWKSQQAADAGSARAGGARPAGRALEGR